jgi:uncharacterized protein YggE
LSRSALTALFAAAALSAAALPALADTAPVKPYDPAVVRVAGRAELYLAPDQARVTMRFYNAGRTSAEAADLVAKRTRALEAAVKTIDAAKVGIERSDVSVSPVMKGGGDRRPDRINGYEANADITILVRDLALLPQAVEAAVNAAPDSFGDVAYSVRDTQAARTKAREAAIKDAVDKARVYTEGAGFRLGRLLLVLFLVLGLLFVGLFGSGRAEELVHRIELQRVLLFRFFLVALIYYLAYLMPILLPLMPLN